VIEVAVGRGTELQRPEADVVQRLVVDTEGLVRVLDELVHGECRVVGLWNRASETVCEIPVMIKVRTSTTVSDTCSGGSIECQVGNEMRMQTLGLGTTENVHIILSGYSSLILEMRSVPIPAPVPPPSECVIWKPIMQT
jgi:hypothetical protein